MFAGMKVSPFISTSNDTGVVSGVVVCGGVVVGDVVVGVVVGGVVRLGLAALQEKPRNRIQLIAKSKNTLIFTASATATVSTVQYRGQTPAAVHNAPILAPAQ